MFVQLACRSLTAAAGFRLGLVATLTISWVAASHCIVESKLELDSSLHATLKLGGPISIKASQENSTFSADASAVVRGDVDGLLATALSYEDYASMGMPTVVECHIVDRAAPDVLRIWSRTSSIGVTSQHYSEVRVFRQLNAKGGQGITWQLIHRQSSWKYPEHSAFKELQGSWYLEPFGDGTVYVRYFLAAQIDSRLPDFLIGITVRRYLADRVRQVIEVIARQAVKSRICPIQHQHPRAMSCMD